MNAAIKRTSRTMSPIGGEDELISRREEHGPNFQPIISAFSTPLGWIGLLGHNGRLISVLVGHSSPGSIRAAARDAAATLEDGDWNPTLRGLFEAYAEGDIIDFDGVEIRLPSMTSFRQRILAATRKLGYGETASYGDLARRVGHPGAARAVGTVMSSNRFPILIPCHRVLAAGGKLGGYTSPAGTDLKQRLLDMEARMSRSTIATIPDCRR